MKTPPSTPDPELMRVLAQAATELRSFPNDVFMSSRFEKVHDLAAFIEQTASRLSAGDLAAGHDLLMVFLPTSDWDDAGGSQDTGNRACEFLEPYFKPKTNAELGASPNGGPAARLGNWSAGGGPPSGS